MIYKIDNKFSMEIGIRKVWAVNTALRLRKLALEKLFDVGIIKSLSENTGEYYTLKQSDIT